MLLLITLSAAAFQISADENAPRPTRPEKGVYGRNWRGMLVDLECGANSSADRSIDPDAPAPFGTGIPHLTLTDWQACPATAQSKKFGLVFYSGRAVRLDDRSNAKVAEELARESKWTSREKLPLAKIKGTLYGDTLQVESMKQIKELR